MIIAPNQPLILNFGRQVKNLMQVQDKLMSKKNLALG